MSQGKELSEELEQNGRGTRELLSRVPTDQLSWKPHEKSMSLGRLAMHVAELPGWILTVLGTNELDFAKGNFQPLVPSSTEEILAKFDDVFPRAVAALAEADDDLLAGIWTMRMGEQIFLSNPRLKVLRTEFGHQHHHRGQLTVYLRMHDVPLPPLFGPTADSRDMPS